MPQTKVIPSDALSRIQSLLRKANEHRMEAEALEFHARHLIVQHTQIDLNDEHWILDLERGLVVRHEEPPHADQPTPPPDVAG